MATKKQIYIRYIYNRLTVLTNHLHINTPNSQACRNKFWAERAINFWWQKGNKFYIESE